MSKASSSSDMSQTESTEVIFKDDEPIECGEDQVEDRDKLDRERFAKAFARLAETCRTPLVVGLYGKWGVGKTSLLKCIKKHLDGRKANVVWFDPWAHQFDENPVVALAQTLFNTLDSRRKEKAKELLVSIAAAFSSTLLKFTTGLKLTDIFKFAETYEKQSFQARDDRVRLREHFEKLVGKAREDSGKKKHLVFFIDDLDRCMPKEALQLLEALKLYLNIKGCVFFLALDRDALEQSVKHHYQDLQMDAAFYLDKIIQLPFTIPPICSDDMGLFVKSLLSKELEDCEELLVQGLGDNPRQVKRFINTLTLNHQLASSLDIQDYNPKVLALLLLIQLITTELYGRIADEPDLLEKLKLRAEEKKELFDKFLAKRKGLLNALDQVDIPARKDLETYIYLTKAASVVKEDKFGLQAILENHERWYVSYGKDGRMANLSGADLRNKDLSSRNLSKAILSGADLSEATLDGADLSEALLIQTRLQHADLSHANLIKAKLQHADLSHANLIGTIMRMADLRGTDLRGAELSDADLRKADLTGAIISEDQLKASITDEETILPDGSIQRVL